MVNYFILSIIDYLKICTVERNVLGWDDAWERPTGYTKIRDHAYVRRRLRKIGSVSCYELISEDDIDSIRYKITKAEDLNEREQETRSCRY